MVVPFFATLQIQLQWYVKFFTRNVTGIRRLPYECHIRATLDDFVRAFPGSANPHAVCPGIPILFRPTHHITTFAPENVYDF
jgi:hypothetical protein